MATDTHKPQSLIDLARRPRSLFSLFLLFALASCSSTETKHEEACADYALPDIQGEYANVASEELDNEEMLLADLLWPNDWYAEKEVHARIDRIAISLSEEGALQAKGYAGTEVVKTSPVSETIRIDGNALDVYSDFSIFPVEGAVVVGPMSMKAQLFLNCEEDLVLHIHGSGFGLAYLLIPVAGSIDEYARFERIAN